jgi:hypothetical protein
MEKETSLPCRTMAALGQAVYQNIPDFPAQEEEVPFIDA